METNQKQMSQKDYLKKYLSKDKGEKKKKKKVKISSSSHVKRSVIIDDDDLGLPEVASIDDEEFNLEYLGDEAPQIAGVIDERPLEIRAKESYGGTNKWKPVGKTEEPSFIRQLVQKIGQTESNLKESTSDWDEHFPKKEGRRTNKKHRRDSDFSPPRKRKGGRDSEQEFSNQKNDKRQGKRGEVRNNKNRGSSESDESLPRKKSKNGDVGHYKRSKIGSKDTDSDSSHSRRNYKEHNIPENHGRNKRDSSSDLSPYRKSEPNKDRALVNKKKKYDKNSDSDLSPPRKNVHKSGKDSICQKTKARNGSDSDLSPPRNKRDKDNRKYYDSDLSPRRKNFNGSGRKHDSTSKRKYSKQDKSRDAERYFDRRNQKHRNNSDSDLSPPRYRNKDNSRGRSDDSDLSPPRQKRKDKNLKEWRQGDSDSDLSPPRKQVREKAMKLDKTLDGKKAGLQDAKNLKEELRKLREKEDNIFSKMKASVSGQNATAVMRDRKTGKIRDLTKEKEEQVEKSAKTIEREKKYAKWGKGLKQIEEAEERIADVIHEMNKPLARYAGDDDLERMLKAQEREGDPMLDYIRSKQAEAVSIDNIGKPKYQGHYMPNRFSIRPGHRWDGVDRSNGYEQKWFEHQNARKAVQEEAYKWSTSDM